MTARDEVYRDRQRQLVDFAFDDKVADVFPDMIRRSVPGYETVVPITGLLAARALSSSARETARGYDLGCSLGASTLAMLRGLPARPRPRSVEVVAVDNAPAMIERARLLVDDPRVRFVCEDIRSLALGPADAITLNYVLQFLPPVDRPGMLERIREALAPDGVLLLSEKIRFDDADTQREFDAAHLDFKRANGYSELEISQKRSALDNVMIIDTEERHRQRLADAGFSRVRKWYQCLNWASFEARP
ncbi:MAG: carboxy-S-adenosyl-L-methionine synthase CmoA [Pseudomonadales bacterium]